MVINWESMRAALTELHAANPTNIELRRGNDTLVAQTVRIARRGSGGRAFPGQHTAETQMAVIVAGEPGLDIQIGDRFTLNGQLYKIDSVRPNRKAGTQAEATMIQ